MLQIRVFSSTLLFLFLYPIAFGQQLPKKANKLVGTWSYVNNKGFEVWEKSKNPNELTGTGYLISDYGDTTKHENLRLTYNGTRLVYYATVYNQNQGKEIAFQSKGKKFFFENPSHDFPRAIRYKFNCLNRKKLDVYLFHPHKNKLPLKISLVKTE